jgi:hypothetical protein
MKVTDLAKAVAPECKIEIVGIRPGEKLHEVLITEEEGRNTVVYNGMYVILPNYSWWERQNYENGQRLSDGFKYTSNNNNKWLTIEDLTNIIAESAPLENDSGAKLATTIHQLNEKIILNMLSAEEGIPETSAAERAPLTAKKAPADYNLPQSNNPKRITVSG